MTPVKRDYPRPPVDLETRKKLIAMGRPLSCDLPATVADLAKQLAERRRSLSIPVKVLAKQLSKAPSTIRAWEVHERIPETPALIAWAIALGMQLYLKEWPAD